MSRTETILRVFVASPKDLAEEREILESVIQELNNTWSKTIGVSLELVKWETHTYPSVGLDVQTIVNDQIADDYDIFIGIMWTRFGTQTKRAGSGTVEEFYRAYNKHKENSNLVRIMFYFKDSPLPLSDLDPEQLFLIKKFQLELGEKGTYYWTFLNKEEFAQLVRIHLSRQVQEWEKSWGLNVESRKGRQQPVESTPVSLKVIETEIKEEDEEEGFLDLLEAGEENLEAMNKAVTRMTNALSDLSTRISTGTEELKQAQSPIGKIDIKQAKKINNRIADALNNFSGLMEVDVPVFANSYTTGVDAYSRALSLLKEFVPEDNTEIRKLHLSFQQLISSISLSKDQLLTFRTTMASTPRATTMYNRAKKRALIILDQLYQEFITALNLTSELEKSIDKLITE